MTIDLLPDARPDSPATVQALLLLDAQKRGLEMLLDNAPLASVLAHLASTVEMLSAGCSVASILLLDDAGALRSGAAPSLPADYQQAIDGIPAAAGVGTCAAAAATGTTVITPDFATDPGWDGLRQLPLALGLRGAWSLPIKAHDGRVLGTFGTYFRECRGPTEAEIESVQILAQTAAIAIERERSERARLNSELDFRVMADNISQMAWMADKDGQPFWFNQRWHDYAGASREYLASDERFSLLHPDHRARVLPRQRQCYRDGTVWEDLFPLRRHDGEYRWFLTRVVPVRDASGAVMRWFGTNTDVTDVRDAQEALREADRRKDRFLATLAHELRNPLAPLVTGLEVMQAYGDPAALQSLQEMMQRQVGHMVRLVDDLMEISRIASGKIDLHKAQIDLRTALQTAMETARPQIDAARHRLIVDMPDQRIPVDADSVRMTQVFANLLNNAARYTPDGGDIRVDVRVGATQVEVSVRDSGRGIAPEHLAAVFDLFFQGEGHEGSSGAGLGLGLTLASELVQLHNGTIEARSAGVDRGSEFIVRLPLARTAAAVEAGKPGQSVARLPYRILVADDNRDAADMLAMLLRYCGADTEVVYDGLSALEAIARKTPEIVVLDLGMGVLDGCETARRIRAQPQYADLPLVALTGWNQQEVRARTAEAGFDAHLVKPVDFDELRKTLDSLRRARPARPCAIPSSS